MSPYILIVLLLMNSLAHLVQAYQSLKDFKQEITPLLVFAIITLFLAIALFLDLPYAVIVVLIFMLVGGIGSGNQIMKLDNGGCINRGIVILDIVIIVTCLLLLFLP